MKNYDTTIPYYCLNTVKDTRYLVEATSCEQQDLWAEYCDRRKLPWEQINPGMWARIAIVNLDGHDMPVCISLSWARLGRRKDLVCFYEATSAVVDYRLVERWIGDVFPRVQTGDAMNFHNCIINLRLSNEVQERKYV